ncbi:hypothetical protein [Thiolapillus sp.]|uniref:hypothetical protein n=1 Tax=Thiolapillus sp. TaxID=2017437 RepID=UPI0025DD0C14|nr:hypothetical protein [Thiolapillus sp.]
MLNENAQKLFGDFIKQSRDYLSSPGIMAALELDKLCMQLYPIVARRLGDLALSNSIRDFGRSLPRKQPEELQALFDDILSQAQSAGLAPADD